jgi:hypothetical protein
MFSSQMKRTYIQWDSLFPFICYKIRGSLHCNNATGQVDNNQSLPPVMEEQEQYIFLYTIMKDITATALQICSTFPLSQDSVMILIPSSYTRRGWSNSSIVFVSSDQYCWSRPQSLQWNITTQHVMWLVLLNQIRNPRATYCIPACRHTILVCVWHGSDCQ